MSVKRIPGPSFNDKGKELIAKVADVIKRLTFKLQRKVKEEKLTGQVLNVRTGRLRRSINAGLSDDGMVGSVGTNVSYGKRWEFGFTGEEKVREHLRTIKQAWGHPLDTAVTFTVRPHTRKLNIQARPFLQPSLDEIKPEFLPSMKAALKGGPDAGA